MPADVSTGALLARPETDIPKSLHAALVVLAAPTLQGFPDIGRYVDFGGEHGRFDWKQALDEGGTWSHNERLLVEAAATLWAWQNPCDLGRLLGMDDPTLRRVLLGIEVYRGWKSLHEALRLAGE